MTLQSVTEGWTQVSAVRTPGGREMGGEGPWLLARFAQQETSTIWRWTGLRWEHLWRPPTPSWALSAASPTHTGSGEFGPVISDLHRRPGSAVQL